MRGVESSVAELKVFFETVLPHLNEPQRRVVTGAMARGLGRGGKSAVAEASGMSPNTVIKAVGEVKAGIEPSDRLRAPGGGDRAAIDKQPGLLEALDELVWPETRGHPMSPLRWTLTSTYELARQLQSKGVPGLCGAGAPAAASDGLLVAGPVQTNRGLCAP